MALARLRPLPPQPQKPKAISDSTGPPVRCDLALTRYQDNIRMRRRDPSRFVRCRFNWPLGHKAEVPTRRESRSSRYAERGIRRGGASAGSGAKSESAIAHVANTLPKKNGQGPPTNRPWNSRRHFLNATRFRGNVSRFCLRPTVARLHPGDEPRRHRGCATPRYMKAAHLGPGK